jgi:hypothetical protein
MKAMIFVLGLFSSVSYAGADTACVGPSMQYVDAYDRIEGAGGKHAVIGSYASFYRSKQCDADDNCGPWEKVALNNDGGHDIILEKSADQNIQAVISYNGNKIHCGLVGQNLTCKDPGSYLSYNGILTNHCLRVIAAEPNGALDGTGNYEAGEDILFGRF